MDYCGNSFYAVIQTDDNPDGTIEAIYHDVTTGRIPILHFSCGRQRTDMFLGIEQAKLFTGCPTGVGTQLLSAEFRAINSEFLEQLDRNAEKGYYIKSVVKADTVANARRLAWKNAKAMLQTGNYVRSATGDWECYPTTPAGARSVICQVYMRIAPVTVKSK